MKSRALFLLLLCLMLTAERSYAQSKFAQWAENPLGFYPLGLESGNGFYWGTAAIAATFLFGEMFSNKDTITRNRFSIFEEPGMTFGYGDRQGYTVETNNVGVQYRVMRWMSCGGEISTYIYQGPLNNTVGFGARPFVRWHFVHRVNWGLFFEYGAGVIWDLKPFPITNDPAPNNVGTQFNFIPKYSIGAEVRLRDKMYISFGIRHVHESNGYIFGPDRNPAFDSDGIFVGIRFDRRLPHVDPLFDNSLIKVKIRHKRRIIPDRQ